VSDDSRKQLLRDARSRAQALLDTITRDAEDLKKSPRFAEGAAYCEDVAEQARRLIEELDGQLGGNSDS
jgi:hypothetical protein